MFASLFQHRIFFVVLCLIFPLLHLHFRSAEALSPDELRGKAGAEEEEETEDDGGGSDSEEIEGVVWIPKCCPPNETLVRTSTSDQSVCVSTGLSFAPVFTGPPPSQIVLLAGIRCKDGSYRLEPHKNSQDEFQLLPNGYLRVPFQAESLISPLDYCLETFTIENDTEVILPLVCFPPQPPSDPWKEIALILYPIGCLTSVPFLLVTIFLHLRLPELRNLMGKALSSYCFCLTVAYLCLASVQIWGDSMDNELCKVIAFMIQFFFVACFFWLNVICFHTWRKTRRDLTKESKSERFLYCCLYGWGCPSVVLAVSLTMDLLPTIPPSYIKPNFGIDACWFQSDDATLSYFYGPISILLSINVAFFVLTLKYLHLSPSRGLHRHLHDVTKQLVIRRKRQIFVQCLLLFCAMGLSWILEVLSWKFGKPAQLWLIVDSFNTLQGLVVFLVFVWRDRVVRRALSRWRHTGVNPPGSGGSLTVEAHPESTAPLNAA